MAKTGAMWTPEDGVVNIVGATSSGLGDMIVAGLPDKVHAAFDRGGMDAVLKGMRFIPSTRVDLDDGRMEILAHTIVEVPGHGERPKRNRSFEAVVVVGTDEADAGQSLVSVTLPELESLQRHA